MPKLIFDIETVGIEFDSLDKTSQDFLLLNAKDDKEREMIKEELGFSPLTGRIVAIRSSVNKVKPLMQSHGKSICPLNNLAETG